MPTRILLRLFFLAGLAAPWCAFALGVGQLEVRSALNQTFEAELPLIINNPAELTGLTARIPRQEEFDRARIERLEFLSKLRFSVQTPPGGPNIVKMTSLEPIREPNFNLLLELVWPRGRLIREFTVQLDPELYANRRQPPAPPPVVALLPPVAPPPVALPPAVPELPPAPPVSFEGASFYGPVKSGETLAAIANRVRPSTAISVPQMMAILIAGNPTAFANGNPNALRSGATLKVPTPQALGASAAPSPSAPEATAAPPSLALAAEPADAPAPADLTTPAPTAVSAPQPVLPPAPAAPVTPSLPITTTPLPTTPLADVAPPPTMPSSVAEPGSAPPSLPPAEPLREIVPQATIPQPETPPAAAPQPPAPPLAATPQPPPAAAPQPPPPISKPKPPAPPPVEAESSWMSNPVVWVAIALIALAIAALIVLPLLRRPTRAKPSRAEEVAVLESTETLPTAVEPREGPTARTRPREPTSVRPRPAAKLAAVPTAAPGRDEAAPSPMGPSAPKPIGELLKDFDFGLGEGGTLPAAARPGMAPARDIKAPLLEAEPPTASVTRHPVSPLTDAPTDLAEQEKQKEAPARPGMELPSELRLDGLNFDLDGLGLGKTARPQPSELPPLEMKPGTAGARKLSEPSLLERGIAEPPTESSSLASTVAVPAGSPKLGSKFEFADVTREMAKSGEPEESLKLDEALQDLGGDTLKLDGKKEAVGGLAGGISAADYVETKLDLASAYLEMGDQVGARSLLDEVLREGDATQKERAKVFLKKLG